MDNYTMHRGTKPLLISVPHDGTVLPEDIAARMTADALRVPDTDWHVARLYAFARELGASIIAPKFSRYVVDLNRSPEDVSLYPGQNTTSLCPLLQFSGAPIYVAGAEPAPDEVRARIEIYWAPYHAALQTEIARIKAEHGRAVVWEGHSIKSVVPFLFEGRLPDFNLGTAAGASCSADLQQRLQRVLSAQGKFSFAINGRFRGGYITRHYGDPQQHINAVQLELAQLNYMDEISFEFVPQRAQSVQQLIGALLRETLIEA